MNRPRSSSLARDGGLQPLDAPAELLQLLLEVSRVGEDRFESGDGIMERTAAALVVAELDTVPILHAHGRRTAADAALHAGTSKAHSTGNLATAALAAPGLAAALGWKRGNRRVQSEGPTGHEARFARLRRVGRTFRPAH